MKIRRPTILCLVETGVYKGYLAVWFGRYGLGWYDLWVWDRNYGWIKRLYRKAGFVTVEGPPYFWFWPNGAGYDLRY